MRDESRRYEIPARLQTARALIEKSSGVTAYDLAAKLEVSLLVAKRTIWALQKQGVPIDVAPGADGKTNVYTMRPDPLRRTLPLTLAQMIALAIVRQELQFLRGTGLDEDFEELCRRFELLIADPKYAGALGIDGRIFYVRGPQPIYEAVPARMGEVVHALFHNERLEITTFKPDKGRRTFTIEPYTLLVHDRLLYLAGYCMEAAEVRKFAYDTIVGAKRRAGEAFERPAEFRPEQLVEGSFGIFGGAPERVRVRFDADVARFVRRMMWHPTQRITAVGGGAIEMEMKVAGMIEVKKWVLSFGSNAEVLEPASLRRAVRDAAREMVLRYRSAVLWGRLVEKRKAQAKNDGGGAIGR